ncbi:type IX secretion system sortase PorU [Larkinella rosea]|uniref:Type IX secretion system sortase PorU n=1 Tax=Larkinella rosea TaxID=2025312 RepID=A0A3P1BCP9_9BACT|nr:type IX secretion system sortase PorU [Larkinella rosea]RRA98701.1 type IX secretion system sortase PorU [Larkinella rosea]
MFGWKKRNKCGLAIGLILIGLGLSARAQPLPSVLADGPWLKIGITKTGVCKLDAAFLTKAGVSVSALDPRTIRLFGNGGAALPQANAKFRARDLTENAIWVNGETDGRFDASDAVYFFAESPHPVFYDSTARRFSHQINPYSDTTYYFLTYGQKTGKRMATQPTMPQSGTVITEFDDYAFYKPAGELTNLVRSGREWLEYLGIGTDKTVSFNLSGLVPNSTALVTSDVVGRALVNTQFQVKWGTQAVGTQAIESVTDYTYDRKGRQNRQTFTVTPASLENPVRLTLSYDKTGQGYLQSLAIQTRRTLRRYDESFLFRSLESVRSATVRYVIQQATATMQVWDVTNRQTPVLLPVTINDKQEGSLTAAGNRLREYLVFSPDQAFTPETVAVVNNQSLQNRPTPDLLVVTSASWRAQAERLADFRRKNDRLDVLVVSSQEVYNEFSSGQPDPTAIRDLARSLNNQTPGKLKYLLLFGDATYDYKNYTKLMTPAQLAATLPTYESRESLHPVLSYSSDDYFGFLETAEGEWTEDFSGDHTLDIGVGRLPVKSTEEARAVVDKLIRYAATSNLPGDWQTKIAFVADDGDLDFPNIHQTDADRLAQKIAAARPPFRIEKLYLDSFAQESSPGGQKAPAMNQAITKALNDGRLIVNYTGHGGESGWAEEQVVTLQDILGWTNQRLPIFVTATCQFGRYDDPAQTSGAELALLNPQGGSIALLTTARPVYASTNYLLNNAFYEALAQHTAESAPRLGELIRLTKNGSLSGSLNRNFTLLGDPSMQLAYPTAKAVLTRINGKTTGTKADTLRALETVRLEGEIRQGESLLSQFNGSVKVTLFDKADTLVTNGTEYSPPMRYAEYRSPLYTGQVRVQNGKFVGQFVMPKDLDYRIGPGKLFLYAVQADSLGEAAGSHDNLLIGNSVPNPVADTKPPTMRLFINDPSFLDGGTVLGPITTLIAKLNDENGINIARSGIGHEIMIRLNNDSPIVANDYFVADLDDYRSGTVQYAWQNLPPGTYTVQVKVWDVYNNPAETTLKFVVSEQPALIIQSVDVAPNPFQEQANFEIRHNRPGDELEATLQIADLSGRTVNERVYQCSNCNASITGLNWGGTLSSGATVLRGLYVYRLLLRSKSDGSSATHSGKLLYSR